MKYLLKHKITFIFITFILFTFVGLLFTFTNSDEYIATLEYSDKLVIKDTIIEFRDDNGNIIDNNNILKVKNITNKNGKTIVEFNSINSGNINVLVKCNFYENNQMNYTSKFYIFKVNKYNMIFTGDKITDLVSINIFHYAMIALIIVLSFYNYIFLKELLIKNKYSYKSILTCSVFLLTSVTGLSYILSMIYTFIFYDEISYKLISLITGNFMTIFVIFSLPLIFIFALLLCISNIILIKKEGFSKYNLLGIIFSVFMFVLFVIELILIIFSRWIYLNNLVLLIIYSIFSCLLMFFESLLFSTIICSFYVTKKEPDFNVDYIIILGCQIRSDGSLTPLLKGRVDRAIDFYNKQIKVNNKELIFVPSGGKGQNEIISEGKAIKKYLVQKDIPISQILVENKSTNTLENLSFSNKLIMNENKNANIIFSTNNYHLFRSGLIASENNLKFDGIGSKTKWYFWPNAFIREIVGIFLRQKISQIIIIILISILAGVSAFVYSSIL